MALFGKFVPNPCPCGSKSSYPDCCGRYLDGGNPAPSAESLMRSRYSAYALKREPYLLATWDPSTRPAALNLDREKIEWVALKVRKHLQQDADHAIVEFEARFKLDGRSHKLHEISRFVRAGDQWLYVDGDAS